MKVPWKLILSCAAGGCVGVIAASWLADPPGIPGRQTKSHGASSTVNMDGLDAASDPSADFEMVLDSARSSRTPAENLRLARVIRHWLNTDLIECLNHLRSSGTIGLLGLLDHSALREALSKAAAGNLAQALALCSQMLDGETRDLFIRIAFEAGAERDLAATVKLLAQIPPHESAAIFETIAKAAASKGEAGIREILRLPHVPTQLLTRSFVHLCLSDPLATARLFATAAELDPSDPLAAEQRRMTLIAILNDSSEWQKKDVPLGLRRAFVEALPEGADKRQAERMITSDMAVEAPSSFFEALPGFTNPAERQTVVREAFDKFLQRRASEPNGWMDAIHIAEQSFSPSFKLEKFGVAASASTWRREVRTGKIPDGLAWSESLPDPMEQAAARNGLMVGWVMGAPEKAFSFVAQALQNGSDPWVLDILPQALSEIANPKYPASPEDAAKMKQRMMDELLPLIGRANPSDKAAIRASLQLRVSPARWALIEPLLR